MRLKESNYLCNIKVQGKEAGDDVEATASDVKVRYSMRNLKIILFFFNVD